MKNKIWIQLSMLVLFSFTLGCEEVQDVAETAVTPAVPIAERLQSAGVATLKNPSATLASISFTAKIKGITGTVPSLLEYTGAAFLEGRLSFGFVMTSTCGSGGIYSTSTTSCPIITGQVYSFNCPQAEIRGKAGAATFACQSANIAGSSYHIYGELRQGVNLDASYAIESVRICGGPGVYPTC